jgi:starch phosphorylase
VSLIEESQPKRSGMAHFAMVGSHSTNGVAAIHSGLLTRTVASTCRALPTRFNNKTNGVTQRRVPPARESALAKVITDAIGDGWITDLTNCRSSSLARAGVPRPDSQGEAPGQGPVRRLARSATGQVVRPRRDLRYAHQRIHEHKRQLLNALHIVVRVQPAARERLRRRRARSSFQASGACAYSLRQAGHQVHQQPRCDHRQDPAMKGRLKVVFVPDYSVSIAERLISASDVSEQISTAGYEASGTGNMNS